MTNFYPLNRKLLLPVIGLLLLLQLTPATAQLVGGTTYPINGTQNPLTSFATVADAFTYLNTNGTSGTGTIVLSINSGYSGETGLIPALTAYPGMNSTRPIELKPGSGQNPSILTSPTLANTSVIRFNGTQYFTIDGSNNGTTTQNLTIRTSSAVLTVTLVALVPTATSPCVSITVKNCILIGGSTTTLINTFAGIFQGNTTTTASLSGGNNNNVYTNNYIQAVRNGIYLRGTNVTSTMDNNVLIEQNIIGGTIAPGGTSNTTYFSSGSTNASGGIYLNSQNAATIRQNIVRNALPAAFYHRGIHLDALTTTGAANTNVVIEKNRISNIIYNGTGGYGVNGIRVQSSNNTGNNIMIRNNFIWNIASDGDDPAFLINYPIAGIILTTVSGGISNTNVGISIYHNSVNLYDNGVQKLSNIYTSAVAADLISDPLVAGGVKLVNNNFSNTFPGSNAANRTFTIFAMHTTSNPFLTTNNGRSNFNNLYLNSSSTIANLGRMLGSNFSTLTNWKANSVDSNSFSIAAGFVSNTDLSGTSKLLNNTGTPLGVTDDIEGDLRSATTPDIGGDEYTILPNLGVTAIISPTTACGLAMEDVTITIRNSGDTSVLAGDTILVYYTINGGAPVWDTLVLTSALGYNATVNYTFKNKVNLTSFTNFTFTAASKYKNDTKPGNDSITVSLQSYNCFSLAANGRVYQEDFETSNGGWTTDGVWVWGTPAKTYINTAGSGTKAWVTTLTGQYPNSANNWLKAPPVDLRGACGSRLSFKMRFRTELNYDAVILETSLNDVTWTKLTTITPAYNNTSAIAPITPPKYSGDNLAWQTYVVDLGAFAGSPLFRYRFRFGSDVIIADDGVAIDSVNLELYQLIPSVQIQGDDTAFINVTTNYLSTVPATGGFSHKWYLNGTLVSTNNDYDFTGVTAGTYTLKNVVSTCLLKDSVTKIIEVITPVGLPVADFVASRNTLDVNGTVKFTNLTTNGAFAWLWIVTPDSAYDPVLGYQSTTFLFGSGSATSKSPDIIFLIAGTYGICLVAQNVNGYDTVCKSNYVVVNSESRMCQLQSFSTDSAGRIYDSGGKNGNYAVNENCTFTIEPACASSVTITVNSFVSELNYDFLKVLDANGSPLHNTALYPDGYEGTVPTPFSITSNGPITLEWESDISIAMAGFDISWTSTKVLDSATASFFTKDTSCVNIPVNFINTSTGSNNSYLWFLDGDTIPDAFTKDADFIYGTPGIYAIVLVASNCHRTDTMMLTIVIQIPPGPPVPGFFANILKPSTSDNVSFSDTSKGCVEYRDWKFTPNTVSFVNGTNITSENPQVRFNQTGCYSVRLLVGNSAGEDSVTQTCYIEVLGICVPTITNLNSDFGISRVTMGSIDQQSAVGTTAYTNYSNTQSTSVEKGVVYSITVERPTTFNTMNRAVWVDYNQDGDFADPGELVAFEPAARTLSWTGSFRIPYTAASGATRLRVGTQSGTLINKPCGPNTFGEFEDYRIFITSDLTLPVITTIGPDTVYTEQGRPYIDAGATALDNANGNLTPFIVTTSTVDTTVVGTYMVFYNVADSSGNQAIQRSRVVIVTPDTTRPVLTLLGTTPDTMIIFNQYNDPGAIAIDIVSGNLTNNIVVVSNLDTSVVGSYTITYTVMDLAGNIASISRTVVVIDTAFVTIMLNGVDSMYLEVFSPYTEAGATATGAGGQPLVVTVSGTVDITKIGTYFITYSAADFGGNVYTKSRKVVVGDTTDPVVFLIGPDTLVIDVHTYFFTPPVVATDNYYASLNIVISGAVDTALLGNYTLTYTVTDGSGNSSVISRVVSVVDRIKPVIELIGPDTVHVERWDLYVDAGYTLNDNYYDTSAITVETLGNFTNTLWPGYYYIEYKATDGSGNFDYSRRRIIEISRTLSVQAAASEASYLNIYPNPSSGIFNMSVAIHGATNINVTIRNMMGQDVKSFGNMPLGKDEIVMDLQRLPQGVYYVVVESEGHSLTKRIVITH